MTFEGAQFQGRQPIMEKLQSLPFKSVAHQVTTIDAQPIIGVDDNKVLNEKKIYIYSILGRSRHGNWSIKN